MRLVRRADGSAQLAGPARRPSPPIPTRKPAELNIDGVEIEDSRLSFVDEGVPRRIEVTALNLTTDEIAPGEPFTDTEIAGVLHMDGFAPAGRAVPARGAQGRAARGLFASVEVPEFTVAFGGFEAEGDVSGTLGEQPKLAGKIETNEFDPARAARPRWASRRRRPPMPQALGKVQLRGDLGLRRRRHRHRSVLARRSTTRISPAAFSRAAGDDPVGEFALRGDALNIARYIPPTDPASEPFVLPTAALKALKFRGSVELEQATLDDIDMKGVTLRLLLDEQGLRSAAEAAEGTP